MVTVIVGVTVAAKSRKAVTDRILLPVCDRISCMLRTIALAMLLAGSVGAAEFPAPVEGDFTIKDFQFTTGEKLPELRLHYTTVGSPVKNAAGMVTNAVIIMHGTGGSGRAFLSPTFGGMLFGAGQLLDATKYYIILPDDIGHG